AVALLSGRWGFGKASKTVSHEGILDTSCTKLARSFGSFPPNRRAMLNNEWLPHTIQTSFGLSLTTSHSAHRTAFCSRTAFRTRSRSQETVPPEPFIREPHRTLGGFYRLPADSLRACINVVTVCSKLGAHVLRRQNPRTLRRSFSSFF